jgi:TPR repeat protein
MAQYNLSQMYANGQGVEQNSGSSLVWMRRSAEAGDAAAQLAMGKLEQRASLIMEETNSIHLRIEAYKWFRLSAAQGYGNARSHGDFMALKMSWAEVKEGDQRVQLFIAGPSKVPTEIP